MSGVGDVSLTCTLNGQTISVLSKGVPECIATSCDVNNWEAEKDQAFDEAVKEVEVMLEAFGMESKTAVIADEYDMNFTKYYLYYSSQEAKAKWDPI